MIQIKSEREIEFMRKTCKLAANTLKYLEQFIVVGTNTEELNRLAHEFMIKHGATPSTLNYHGFPKSICTSRNEVICHGIPSKKDVLKDGDILNVDVTTYLNKFHGDTNRTFLIGRVRPEIVSLVDVAYQCMMSGIEKVRPGARLGDIGHAIETLAHSHGFSVVEDYCGHGIGREFHEDPQVLHFGDPGTGPELRPGMIFTIEPMINLGKKHTQLMKDGWTVVTKDRKWSAQFEHTVLVTENGVEVLTLPD